MGGSAFGAGPDVPYTPRMPHHVYRQVRDMCHSALREVFVYVATPIEGPAKKDHGDVDILVCLERRLVFPSTPDDQTPMKPRDLMTIIQDKLGAGKHAIIDPTSTSANFAIPWPSEPLHDPGNHDIGQETSSKQRHIQVDVRICKDLDQLSWALFKHAHGDIWNLIGSTIRPFGLTVDEDALWLRVPEIEKFDRKRAKVLLTQDPVETIQFLGMKVEGFWDKPFLSIEALFEYVTTCRLFWVKQAAEEEAGNDIGVTGGDEGKTKLKSNERRRMHGRPVYRQWINEYIPRLRAEGRFSPADYHQSISGLRAVLREEAFSWFFVQETYNTRLREFRLQRSVDETKGLIKGLIPDLENQYRACVMSAMRKIILEDDTSFGLARPAALRVDGVYDAGAVRDFIIENWEQVGEVAWEILRQRNGEHIRLKGRQKKTAEGM